MLQQEHIKVESATCGTPFVGAVRTMGEPTLQEVEARLDYSIKIGRVLTVDIAMYIAYVHQYCFAQDTRAWLDWCEQKAERSRRDAFRMRKIGEMFWRLDPRYYDLHKTTDIYKLDIIAQLPDHRQIELLDHKKIRDMNRPDFDLLVHGKDAKPNPTTEEKRKAEGEQMELADYFGEIARWQPTKEEVIEKASTLAPSVIYANSARTMMLLEVATKMNRMADIPADQRKTMATQMRQLAEQLDHTCEG